MLLVRFIGLVSGNVAVADHQIEHGALPSRRRLWMFERVVARRILQQPGQEGALRQVELACMDAEIRLRRGLDADGEVAVVAGIHVQRQQLIFAVVTLQPPCQPRLAQFPAQRALAALVLRQVEGACKLLAEGAGARERPFAAPVAPCGAGDGQQIDARMLVEAAVFGGDGGLAAGERDLREGQRHMLVAVRGDGFVERPALPVDDQDARRGHSARHARRLPGAGQISEEEAVKQDD